MKDILLALINKLNIFYVIIILLVLGYFSQEYVLELIEALTPTITTGATP